ncbi:hypothetical protein H6G33_35040 [Calothrix sp. FACHB-1219]|uniref:hypothetical protein n=1 Tax=unclassified Calothrix TaxID=2619626 RepID=UPI001682DAD4|nr:MULTISPECIES: hypothetical protein [unclassified Calothrix]MBD2207553.1 hypothetical protein [Calothrix sp. FACHB-168]MBD2222154.1 hypothetical protein [Calothrix sp. FACHB-1219]
MQKLFFFKYQTPSNVESSTLTRRYIKAPKALQELPLILIPENLLSLSVEMKQHPFIQTAIQKWLDTARKNDELLRIKRRWIPHLPIYIPDTLKGQEFFKIAKAIGEIPLTASVLPKNQNQFYWLKTLHYFWQARGVVIAQQLLGLIQDPFAEGGVLVDDLPESSINNLKMTREIDIACYQILLKGEKYIKQWAKKNKINYGFSHPLELFIDILKQDFLYIWHLGPYNQDWEWVTKRMQRDNIATRAYLLKEAIWQESSLDNAYYSKKKEEYLKYLQEAGWNAYWLLAMRSQITSRYNKHLEPYLEKYLNAFTKGKELFVDEFDWRSGEPYKKRETNGKITNSPRKVKGTIDEWGHIVWVWD